MLARKTMTVVNINDSKRRTLHSVCFSHLL